MNIKNGAKYQNKREILIKKVVDKLGIKYITIDGDYEQRFDKCVRENDKILSSK